MHETNSVNFTSGSRRASGSSPFHQDIPYVPRRHDNRHRSSPPGNFQRPHICRYLIQPIDSRKESPSPRHRYRYVQLGGKIQPPSAQNIPHRPQEFYAVMRSAMAQKSGSPKSFLFSTNFPLYFSFQKLHWKGNKMHRSRSRSTCREKSELIVQVSS